MWRSKRTEPLKANEGKFPAAEKGLFYPLNVSYKLHSNHKQISKSETENIKRKITMKNHQVTKVYRNRRKKEKMERQNKQKAKCKMAVANPCISTITINTNKLNSPIKKHRVAVWIFKKHDITLCHLQKTHFSPKDTHRLKVKGWMIFQTSRNQMKASLTIRISDKIGVKPKILTREKEDLYISIKVSIHQGDITSNMFTPNN